MRSDAARNRAALIEAALRLFNEHGLAPTLDDVAQAAGVGVATAYRHFPNKTELAFAALEASVQEMLRAAEAAASAPDGWSGLVEFFEVTIQAQAGQHALRDALTTDPESASMLEVYRRVGASMTVLLARAQRQGTVREDVVSSDIAVLVTLLGEVVRRFGPVAPDIWKRFMPLLLDGLRPGATTAVSVAPLSKEDFLGAMARQARAAEARRGGPRRAG
ncbi:TetR/AcrR family transcriptional regulator [Promicromonospora sp. CA-289599]|uniref:TetR/AcrR family transcriptional regulator n=1 Tax=Promicromonospora sp. CA-289599 TaxID=3240014 RepID=UPI003D8B4639